MKRKDLILKLAKTLVRRRSELVRALAENTSIIAANDRPVGDSVDAAVDSERDELDSQLAAVESREIAEIDEALDRIRDGNYGKCDGCGQAIPALRLQALPYATCCIKCQRDAEQLGHEAASAFHWERVTDQMSEDEPQHGNTLELEFV
jgi:DnaK suppressor protein